MNIETFIKSFLSFWSWEFRLYWENGKHYQIPIELYDYTLQNKTLFFTVKYNHESGSLYNLSELKMDYRPNLNRLSNLILENFDIDYIAYEVLDLENNRWSSYHFHKVDGKPQMKTNFI